MMMKSSSKPPAAPADWCRAAERATEEDGYFVTLGDHHWAFFVEQGPVLLVTFDTAEEVGARDGNLPEHHPLAKAQGWSHMSIIADGDTWWRDPAVFQHFDRMVDDGFIDDFDTVLFYGAGTAGYAAAAYSAVAPGSTVLLVAPRATMDPVRAGWDDRHRAARRINFTDRYGYAPDMTEGAGQVWLVHDPLNLLDAMHAALFQRPWVTRLDTRFIGEGTEDTLIEMRILNRMIEAAGQGTLSSTRFSRWWRGRRSNATYLRAILAEAQITGHRWREIKICRSVTSRLRSPRFERRLAELTGKGN